MTFSQTHVLCHSSWYKLQGKPRAPIKLPANKPRSTKVMRKSRKVGHYSVQLSAAGKQAASVSRCQARPGPALVSVRPGRVCLRKASLWLFTIHPHASSIRTLVWRKYSTFQKRAHDSGGLRTGRKHGSISALLENPPMDMKWLFSIIGEFRIGGNTLCSTTDV